MMPGSRAASRPVCALILAAGRGKRMKSGSVKLLPKLAGAPMIRQVARAAASLSPAILGAVVGHQASEVEAALSSDGFAARTGMRFVVQEQQLGTAHAVLQSESIFSAVKR